MQCQALAIPWPVKLSDSPKSFTLVSAHPPCSPGGPSAGSRPHTSTLVFEWKRTSEISLSFALKDRSARRENTVCEWIQVQGIGTLRCIAGVFDEGASLMNPGEQRIHVCPRGSPPCFFQTLEGMKVLSVLRCSHLCPSAMCSQNLAKFDQAQRIPGRVSSLERRVL